MLPIVVRLKIAAAAKTDFGLNIFVAPVGFPSSAITRPVIAGFPIPDRRGDLRAKNQQIAATKLKSFPRSPPTRPLAA
jgi:hypothetical protein